MASRTSAGKRPKVRRVMGQNKRGTLKAGQGGRGKIRSRKQPIAMSRSGQSRNKGGRSRRKAS